ncbi:type II secretion system protein E (plasmid) [Allomeiothermus silvanus DSM 9946]|uniref:Type II secretion system protein E n=1 Tax=Allomeiothermus silvanus (strain ATCC 700542 / DSM 9946 / NBRC 106475 / NCIMB 13440 / VI-R2) TaxID=526227 RepID=D7BJL9_ALLS1|nr:GspE/PulE family protein [Allomeiothermus silvanus]ADH65375.1 type II secretion system protein E [Allomeiothermus silvanus DSM 9946]
MQLPDENRFFDVLVKELRVLPPLRATAQRKHIKESGKPLIAGLLGARVPPSAIEEALSLLGFPPLVLRSVDREVLSRHSLEEWERRQAIPITHEGGLWVATSEPFDPDTQALAAALGAAGVGYAAPEGLMEVLRAEGAQKQPPAPPVAVAAASPATPATPSRVSRVLKAAGLSLAVPEAAAHDVEQFLVQQGQITERVLYAELARAAGCPLWTGLDGLILERMEHEALHRLKLLPVRRGGEGWYVSPRAFVEEEIREAGLEPRPVALIYPEIWQMAYRSAQRGAPPTGKPKSALEALYRQGRIERAFFEQHQNDPKRAEALLLAQGTVSEEQLTEARAQVLGMPYIDLINQPPDPAVRKRISDAHTLSMRAIPHHINEAGELIVVVSDPEDIQRNDELKMLLRNIPLRLALASPSAIQRVITRTYGQQRDLQEVTAMLGGEEGPTESLEVEGGALDRLVGSFIREAILSDASDIHVETHKTQGVVRMRRDGLLYEYTTLPLRSTPAVIQKIKVKANLDIAERRRPQDGRFRFKEQGLEANIRVSTVPGMYGEKAVLRLLKSEGLVPQITDLGFQPDTLELLRRIVRRPYGLFLITGPTGSGKTRTGISILGELSRPEVNVLTVEDPVEYEIPGITQVQVNPQAGVKFVDVLRAFLRQDPDIIYVGEIRDRETAQVAVQAAFTGHLVIATLHTNDAPSSATRLMDLGVDPANVSAALLGVLAQRLVRKVCPHCSTPDLEERSSRMLGRPLVEALLPNPQGCRHCYHGYAGRTGIFELMEVTREMQSLLAQNPPTDRIREAARAAGMRTLMEDGILKVEGGITTAEEVLAKTMA